MLQMVFKRLRLLVVVWLGLNIGGLVSNANAGVFEGGRVICNTKTIIDNRFIRCIATLTIKRNNLMLGNEWWIRLTEPSSQMMYVATRRGNYFQLIGHAESTPVYGTSSPESPNDSATVNYLVEAAYIPDICRSPQKVWVIGTYLDHFGPSPRLSMASRTTQLQRFCY